MHATGQVAGALTDEIIYPVFLKETGKRLIHINRLTLRIEYQAEIQHTIQRIADYRRLGEHFALPFDLPSGGLFGRHEFCCRFFFRHNFYLSLPARRSAAFIRAITSGALKGLTI